MKLMFVCPCKSNDKTNPVVFKWIESIMRTHPNADILVCDSNSDDQTYIDIMKNKYPKVKVSLNNKHFGESALQTAYNEYPDYDYYFIMHDSTEIHEPIDNLLCTSDFYAAYAFYDVGCWSDSVDNGGRKDWAKKIFKETNYEFLEDGIGHSIYGSIFLISRKLLTKLYKNGADKFLPSNKKQSEAMERVWGMLLKQENYPSDEYTICGFLYEKQPRTRNDGIITKIGLRRL